MSSAAPPPGSAPRAAHGVKHVKVHDGANPFKLVACDMDGTLLSGTHVVSDFTRTVLSQLLARGVHVIFATGRPFTDVNRIKRQLNIFARAGHIPTPGVQVVTPSTSSPQRRFPPGSAAEMGSSVTSDSSGVSSREHSSVAGTPVGGGRASETVIPRCFAITSNGSCIYNEVNERVYEQCIDPRICRALYAMYVDDPEVNVNVFRGVDADERARANYVNPSDIADDRASEEWVSRYPSDVEAALYRNTHFTFRVVPDLEKTYATDHVNEIFFLCYNPEKAAKVERDVTRRMEELRDELKLTSTVRVAPSLPYCLDCIATGVSKASALQYVLDQLKISMADCIAFGDGMNDVEMLASVGKGCIMENGSERLKERLPHLEVIGSNDSDGVARKLTEVFGLDVEA